MNFSLNTNDTWPQVEAPKKQYSCSVLCLTIFLIVCCTSTQAFAANSWQRAIETIVRGTDMDASGVRGIGRLYSLGLDSRRVFLGQNRNLATVVVQIDVWCTDNQAHRAGFFDHDHDCEPAVRATTANFHISGDGRFNFLVGHPEVPFGLEHAVTSNRTLRSLLTPRDLGIKADWGFGINGTLNGLSYASTLTRGSGMEYKHKNQPWAWAGRIGTAFNSQRFLPQPGLGVSWFKGEILGRNGTTSERHRVAVDAIRYVGRFGLLSQVSMGKTDRIKTWNLMLEANVSNGLESKVGYLQFKSFNEQSNTGWQAANSVTIGVRLGGIHGWTYSAQFTRELTPLSKSNTQSIFDLQFKYRWE